MTAGATGVAEVFAERMAERLNAYRECVARVARGDGLPAVQGDELPKVMQSLGLPGYAFRRDVQAMREAARASEYRRAELAVLHPQVFDEPRAWVRDRIDAVARHRARA